MDEVHDAGASYTMGVWHLWCCCGWKDHIDSRNGDRDARLAVAKHYRDVGLEAAAREYERYWLR